MPVDFSPYTAPVPESSTSRGLRGVGDALDAVLARRQAMEQARLQREQADVHARMVDARTRDATAVQAKSIEENRNLRQTQFGLTLAEKKAALEEQRRLHTALIEKQAQEAELKGDYEGAKRIRAGLNVSAPVATDPSTPDPQSPTPGPAPGALVAKLLDPTAAAPPPVSPNTGLAPSEAPPAPLATNPASAVATRPPAPPPVSPGKALADEWYAGQMATNPPPSVATIIKQEAPNIALRGRGYIDVAARLVNEERNRISRAENAARALEAAKLGRDKGNDLKDVTVEQKLLTGLKEQVLNVYNVRGKATEENTLNELSRISNGAIDNSALARMLQGRWARFGQGAGVLTDRDLNIFYRKILGLPGQFATTIADILSGKTPPAVTAEIEKAIDELRKGTLEKEQMIGGKIVAYAKAVHAGSEREAAWLELHAPGYKRPAAKAAAAPTAPALPDDPAAKPAELERRMGLGK